MEIFSNVWNILTTENEMVTKIYSVAKKVNDILKEKLDIEGLTLIQNNGHGQDVKHFHIHKHFLFK